MNRLPDYLKITLIGFAIAVLYTLFFHSLDITLLLFIGVIVGFMITLHAIPKIPQIYKVLGKLTALIPLYWCVSQNIFLSLSTIIALLVAAIYLIIKDKELVVPMKAYMSVILALSLFWLCTFSIDLIRTSQLKEPIFASVDKKLDTEYVYVGVGYKIYLKYEVGYLPFHENKGIVQGVIYLGKKVAIAVVI